MTLFTFTLLLTGPGVKVNYEIPVIVGNMDIVPTALRVLGLKPSPWWRGKVMNEVFQDGVL